MRNKVSTIQRNGFEITKFDDGSIDIRNMNPQVLIDGDKSLERMRSGNLDNFFKWITNVNIVLDGKWCFSHTVVG